VAVTRVWLISAVLFGGCFPYNFDQALEDCDAGLYGCARDAGSTDAGPVDGGTIDAGTIDAGHDDAGATDAGTADAGTPDAGPADAGGPSWEQSLDFSAPLPPSGWVAETTGMTTATTDLDTDGGKVLLLALPDRSLQYRYRIVVPDTVTNVYARARFKLDRLQDDDLYVMTLAHPTDQAQYRQVGFTRNGGLTGPYVSIAEAKWNTSTGYVSQLGSPVDAGVWFCVQAHFAPGHVSLSIDGQLRASVDGGSFDAGLTHFSFGATTNLNATALKVLVGDVLISDVPVPCP